MVLGQRRRACLKDIENTRPHGPPQRLRNKKITILRIEKTKREGLKTLSFFNRFSLLGKGKCTIGCQFHHIFSEAPEA
jgi:hypothetical protein